MRYIIRFIRMLINITFWVSMLAMGIWIVYVAWNNYRTEVIAIIAAVIILCALDGEETE